MERIIENQFDLEINLKKREVEAIKHELNRTIFLRNTLEYTIKNEELPPELQSNQPFALSLDSSLQDLTDKIDLDNEDFQYLGLLYKVKDDEFVK